MVDLERMLDLATPWCLHVAATLRIPDHIAAGHTDIAARTQASGRFVVECRPTRQDNHIGPALPP